jgi:hypothetical protein
MSSDGARRTIVIATLAEDGEREVEVFGPFTTERVAQRWCDEFEQWMERAGKRKVEHLLITKVADPSFVHTEVELVTSSGRRPVPQGTIPAPKVRPVHIARTPRQAACGGTGRFLVTDNPAKVTCVRCHQTDLWRTEVAEGTTHDERVVALDEAEWATRPHDEQFVLMQYARLVAVRARGLL